ncbi:unnamed protein product [Hapterophycus canaliculatus]
MAAVATDATCAKIWQELRKLRDDIPPPLGHEHDKDEASAFYNDYAAFAACNEVRTTIGRCSELPRDQFLDIFTRLVAGPRLEELFSLFKFSRSPPHPALQYACLVALHGVAELSERRKDLLARPDFIEDLCAVMASPCQRLVTPSSSGAGGREIVNAASGAVTTITGLFTSNGTLEPAYAKLWVEHGAVDALASCLESHAAFDRTNPVSNDLPLCFFLIATSLLAGAADSVSDEDKMRLGEAWIKIFVEANMWVAHEAADLLADFYTRPNWLKSTVGRIPESLRARAVQAARACEREGKGGGSSWKRGTADRLALALLCGNTYTWGEGGKLVGKKCAGPGCVQVQKCGDSARGDSTSTGGGGGGAAAAGSVSGDGSEGVAVFKRCSKCRAVSYCSRECQKTGWKSHRKACVGLRPS